MFRLQPSVLFLSASLLLACGGSSAGGAQPKAAEPPPGPSIPASAAPEDKAKPSVTTLPTTLPSTEPTAGNTGSSKMKMLEATRELDEGVAAFKAAGKDCVTLCKALASMTRAAERICALATSSEGAEKQRCDDARAKVTEATQTVKSTCGGCASP